MSLPENSRAFRESPATAKRCTRAPFLIAFVLILCGSGFVRNSREQDRPRTGERSQAITDSRR